MNHHELDRQIDEIEQAMVRDDPAFAARFDRFDAVSSRVEPVREPHRRAIRALAAIGLVLLLASIAMASAVASLVAVAALATAITISERDERQYLKAIALRVDPDRDTSPTPSLARHRPPRRDL